MIDPPCDARGHVPPLFERDQEADGVCSITGGYVVRDPGLSTLFGRYLYGDLCVPRSGPRTTNGLPGTATGMSVPSLVSFGQDACGRIYTVSLSGPVSRIRDGAGTPCDLPEPDRSPPPRPPHPAARPRPRQAPARRHRRRPHRRPSSACGGAPGSASGALGRCGSPSRSSEPATVRTSLRVPGVATLRSASCTLAPGIPRAFRISTTGPAGSGSAGPSRAARAWRRSRSPPATPPGTCPEPRAACGCASRAARRQARPHVRARTTSRTRVCLRRQEG